MSDTKAKQPENPTQPEGNGAAPEANGSPDTSKLFTQEQLNQIITERLARERAKAEPDPIDLREKELAAREGAIACKEYMAERGYPERLIELFDTSDADKFKELVEKLDEIVGLPAKGRKTPVIFTKSLNGGGPTLGDFGGSIAEAFRRKD